MNLRNSGDRFNQKVEDYNRMWEVYDQLKIEILRTTPIVNSCNITDTSDTQNEVDKKLEDIVNKLSQLDLLDNKFNCSFR